MSDRTRAADASIPRDARPARRVAVAPALDQGGRPRAARVGRCPDCRGTGRLPGPDATGALERCPWCDGSGALTA